MEKGEISLRLSPSTDQSVSHPVETQFKIACLFFNVKLSLHEFLRSEPEDKRQLKRLGKFLQEFEDKVIKRIEGKRPFSAADKRLFQEAGAEAALIVGKVKRFHPRIEKRFHSRLQLEHDCGVSRGVVISVDLARYSAEALRMERHYGAKRVWDLNERIRNRFMTSLRAVGADPRQTPMDCAGDGALIFLPTEGQSKPKVDVAVNFALSIQGDDFQEKIFPDRRRRRPGGFRTGITVGEFYLVRKENVIGDLVGFESAGCSIIDAVRIQQACVPGRIIISEQAFKSLSNDWRARFPRRSSIKSKPHERRTIPVRRMTSA